MLVPATSPDHLASLSAPDRGLLQPHVHPLQLEQRTILYDAEEIINQVYFPTTGLVSLVIGNCQRSVCRSRHLRSKQCHWYGRCTGRDDCTQSRAYRSVVPR